MKAYSELIPGTDVSKIILENDNGVLVELLSMGAGIRKVAVLDGGHYVTLTQSFTDYKEYIENNTAYDGKTLAPNAGRFDVKTGIDLGNGNVIHPEANERGVNSLHGSSRSVSTDNWKVENVFEDGDTAGVSFATRQADGLCGWPGNRDYKVIYTLNNAGDLSIDLFCSSDKDTYVNMSNHAYWNVNVESAKAMEQRITIAAEGVVYNDEESIPYKIVPIETVIAEDGFDVNKENILKDIIPMDSGTEYSLQMQKGRGLNNAFVFAKDRKGDECLCKLTSTCGKFSVEMFSDAPAMVVYTSGYMDEGLPLENGQISGRACSIACEFQEMPSASEPTILKAGGEFRRNIKFRIIH